MNEGQKIHVKLILAGRHALKLLKMAKKVLDGLPLGVAPGIIGARLKAFTALVPRGQDGV
jgi:hypothetical protein